MSRRAKFALITWIGPAVSPLKKAKVSTDKAFVKQVIPVSMPVPVIAPVQTGETGVLYALCCFSQGFAEHQMMWDVTSS